MSRKQRVLFIRSSYLPSRVGAFVVPPLGILTLAAVLRRERPNEVEFKLLDAGVENLDVNGVARKIREYEPDVVGISALSMETKGLHGIAKAAKILNPETKVIIGGPHATNFYDMALTDSNVDYAVVGEGEDTLVELLDAIRDGSSAGEIAGVASRQDGEILFAGNRPFQEDLDSIPMPAWDLIDLDKYTRKVSMNTFTARMPYAALFSSRACPYKCIYCHGIFGKKFRAQSPERTLEEIEVLSKQHGVRELHIFDDVFNFKRDRVMAIMEGVLDRGIDMKFAFPNGMRGDIMTRDMVKILARAGTYSITYAVESASPRLQKLIHKNLDIEKVFEVVDWTYDEGIIPCGFFMFGFPTETPEEMEQTLSFAVRSKMLRALFFSVVPFPRTALFDLAKETYPDYNFDYNYSPGMYYESSSAYFTDVTGIDVDAIRQRAWRAFYLKPWRMAGLIRRLPRNKSFLVAVYHGLIHGPIIRSKSEDTLDMETPAPHSEESSQSGNCPPG